MKETNRVPILVIAFLFFLVCQEYEGVKAHEDGRRFLTADNHRKADKLQESLKQSRPIIIEPFRVSLRDFLCQGISFINNLLNINLLNNLCKDSTPYQATTSRPTTIKPLTEKVFAFSSEGFVYLTCDQMPGTIKLIDATFGFENSSCPPINIASNLSQYINGKTSVMPSGFYVLTYCSTMAVDVFDTAILTITCPTGTIVLDSATYGSIDAGDVCPPTSVIGYPEFQVLTSALTSFSLAFTSEKTFYNLCPADTFVRNKLSVTYHCVTPSAPLSSLKSVARPSGDLHMVCPQGVIDVTSLILRPVLRNSSCSHDATTLLRSLVPSETTEVYLRDFSYFFTCVNSDAEMMASYTCVGTSVSQFTLVAQESANMILKCPYGQKIQLVSSKYYCATNSSEKVYQNPAGVVSKCDGKEGTCYFFVWIFNVLGIPYDPSIAQYPAFAYCPPATAILGGDHVSLTAGRPASMLSITYTCTG